MTALRQILAPVGLTLLLAVTSLHMAVARGQATAVGEMVLCIGGGVVSVPVDAQGNPTGPAHICPDCALSMFDAVGAGADQSAVPAGFARVIWPDGPSRMAVQTRLRPSARGPPVFV